MISAAIRSARARRSGCWPSARRPRRLVLAGMGLAGLLDTGAPWRPFPGDPDQSRQLERGTPEWMAEAFLKTTERRPGRAAAYPRHFRRYAGRRAGARIAHAGAGAGGARGSTTTARPPRSPTRLPDATLREVAGQPYERGDEARAGPGDRGLPRGLTARPRADRFAAHKQNQAFAGELFHDPHRRVRPCRSSVATPALAQATAPKPAAAPTAADADAFVARAREGVLRLFGRRLARPPGSTRPTSPTIPMRWPRKSAAIGTEMAVNFALRGGEI